MSTFKVLLISVNCGIALFGFVAFLSVVFHSEFLVPIIALVFMPGLAIVIGRRRKAPKESRLWTALAVAGVLAPLTWIMFLLIALTHSDI
jgi:uncharacterized membrane protein